MNRILSYIRHNRLKVAGIIIAIILGLSLIRAADNMYAERGKNNIKESVVKVKTDGSVDISNSARKQKIDEFLTNCTLGKYKKAYTYLSEDCKTNLYPTEESFINDYCLKKAIKNKNYAIEQDSNISSYTYKITFKNMLSSGKKVSTSIQDYYTVTVDNGNEIKLNINGLLKVESKEINKNVDDLDIQIKGIAVYKDYQEVIVNYINKSNSETSISNITALDSDNKELLSSDISKEQKINSNEIKKYKFNTKYDKILKKINISVILEKGQEKVVEINL